MGPITRRISGCIPTVNKKHKSQKSGKTGVVFLYNAFYTQKNDKYGSTDWKAGIWNLESHWDGMFATSQVKLRVAISERFRKC